MKTMDELWTNFNEYIKSKMAVISYTAWFSGLELIEKTDDTLIIKIDDPFKKDYILRRDTYVDLIDEAIISAYGIPLNWELYTESELQNRKPTTKKVENKEVTNIEPEVNRVGTNLNPELTFENYVVGETNKHAQLMALSVAEEPGTLYNPLFIYGKSGLGKTHLMNAIGNYIVENSDKRVLYVPSEEFTDDFQQIYRNLDEENTNILKEKFREKYRNTDVLIIDDIQRLAKKEKTQDEFFSTFESLYKTKKQIIIASDTSPSDLQAFEDRLKTRFAWGLPVTINPPDFELKKKILLNKLSGNEAANRIDDNVLDYIANNSENDVRTLEGIVNRLIFLMAMFNPEKIDLEFAKENLKDTLGKAFYTTNNIGKILKAVADYYGFTIETLKSKGRKKEIKTARHVAMYLCRTRTEETWQKIGAEFVKDHATVIHAVDSIEKKLKTDDKLKQDIKNITDKL